MIVLLPLVLPMYGFVFMSERRKWSSHWKVGNRQMFGFLQTWWDKHPDVEIRLFRVGRIGLLWSSKSNLWVDR